MKTKNPFYEFAFVLLVIFSLFMGLSLFSYSAEDPAYSNIVFSRYDDTIHNLFGKAGAFTADILGTAFGWAALLIPFGLVYLLVQMVKLYRGRSSRGRLLGSFFAALLFIITISVLSGLVGETDPYFAHKPSGGILGVTGAVIIRRILGRIGGIILCAIVLILCAMAFAHLTPGDIFREIAARLDGKKTDTFGKNKERLFGFLNIFKNRFAMWQEKRKAARLEQERLRARREALLSSPDPEPTEVEPVHVEPIRVEPIQVEPAPSEIPPTQAPLIVPQFRSVVETPDETEDEETDEYEEEIEDDEEDVPFTLPEGKELLTVAKLEEILNRHEAAVGRDAPGTPPSDEEQPFEVSELVEEKPVEEPVEPISTGLSSNEAKPIISDYPLAVSAATNVTHKVYGDDYKLDFNLLDNPPQDQETADPEELQVKADLLMGKLMDFGVDGRVREIRPGPVVTLFELEPAPGIKINKIANLENDLALAMSARSIRIIAPIPGKAAVGIEVPNATRAMVSMRELLETKEFKQNESPLAVALGKDISGRPYYSDLRKMPHLLVAGTTGSGKSVCVNTIICSVLYKSAPDKVKFVMIDPKMVELSVYEGIPHLMAPVVTEPRKASLVLQNVVKEMEQRYTLMASCKVRSIDSYNELAATRDDLQALPYMIVIVDEFADLMMVAGKEVENSIIRIAQMARAVGIHLVLATQRPSVNVITGIIKANMPARISFRVSSKIDSRTILDQNGAELLLGKGDSLFIPPGSSDPLRIHGSFVSEKEVLRIVEALSAYGEPEYNMDLLEDQSVTVDEDDDVDELYSEAVKVARERGSVSVSMVQRYLRIGYNRAARIVEEMERRGMIGPSDGTSKPREFIK